MSRKQSHHKFDARAVIARMQSDSLSYKAAKLVLVGGQSQADVCRQLGLTKGTVSGAVSRIRRAQELAKLAV